MGLRPSASTSRVLWDRRVAPVRLRRSRIAHASELRLADRTAPTVDTVVTNVPGPQQPLYLAGAQLLQRYGLGLVVDGKGLFHTVLSYNGELSISATACSEMLPDPDFYAKCLQSSFDEPAEASAAMHRTPRLSAPLGCADQRSSEATHDRRRARRWNRQSSTGTRRRVVSR